MAITQVRSVEIQRFNAFAEPAFPSGHWLVSMQLAHDASGGQVTLRVEFQTDTSPLSARMFSIEQLSILELARLGNAQQRLETRNMRTFQRAQVPDHGFAVVLADVPVAGRALLWRSGSNMPWFMGSPRIAGSAAGFDLINTNGGVGERTTLVASGYFWEPVAANASGGPQRPTTALYGQ